MMVPSAHFRIAATSDVHMHLTGWDALRDTAVSGRGMDQLASVIRAERDSAPGGWALFDNGDVLQGTPEGDVCLGLVETHPWPAILNALDYDAVGLGNHDFDFGLPFLQGVMGQVDCPVLCANARSDALTCTHAHTLIDRDLPCSDGRIRPVRLGVTSVLPPQTGMWNRRCLDGSVRFVSGVRATRDAVRDLRNAGADLVVVLCHSGLSDGLDATGENFGAAIAAEVPDVDAIILGHTHLRFPGPDHAEFEGADVTKGTLHGVPAVMPGHASSELGLIDFGLDYTEAGWRVSTHTVRRRAIAPDTQSDPQIARITSPVIEATKARLDEPVARVPDHLNSWFSMLRPSRAETLVAHALSSTIEDAVAGTDLAQLPRLASVAPAALGGRAGAGNFVDIPPGVVRERHVAMLCPYPNTVWAAVLTGAEIWDWIERGLAYFADGTSADGALTNPSAPGFNFDTVHGIEAEVDPFAPAAFDVTGHRVRRNATRVRRLSRRGRNVEPSQRFVLAMTSYRGAGGGNFPGIGPHTRTVKTDVELRDAVRAQLGQNDPFPEKSNAPAFRFVPAGTETRVIRTAPAAQDHLVDIAAFDPRPLGLDDEGFLRVAVTI